MRARLLVPALVLSVTTTTLATGPWGDPALAAGLTTFDTSQGAFTVGEKNLGWWSPTLPRQASDNYLVGGDNGDLFRNYFTFDLRTFSGPVTCATLQIRRGGALGAPLGYALYDVSTAPAILNDKSGTSTAIYDDLGTGTLYGGHLIEAGQSDSTLLSFALNPAGVAAVAAAAGDYFSIGGTMLNGNSPLDPYIGEPPSLNLFRATGSGIQQLVVGGPDDTCPAGDPAYDSNLPPDVSAIVGDQAVSEGDEREYAVTAVDYDGGEPLTYSWSVAGPGASIDGPDDGPSVMVDFVEGPGTVELAVDVSDTQGATATRTLSIQVVGSPSLATFDTSQSPFTPGQLNQGWWSATVPRAASNIYFTGDNNAGDLFRNYFTFDLSSLTSEVTCATFQVRRGGMLGPELGYMLSDVTTPVAALNTKVGTSSAIYEDLATGTRYGLFVVPAGTVSETLSLALDARGIAAVNAGAGGFFSLGGTLVDPDSIGTPYAGVPSFLRLFQGSSNVVRLVVGDAGHDCPPATVVRLAAAPEIETLTGDQTVVEGDERTYTATASDADGDELSFEWSIVEGKATIDGPANGASVDVDFSDGPSTVLLSVRVSDGTGAVGESVLTIEEGNVAPTLSDLAATIGAGCTPDAGLSFSFTDPAGANDTYTGTIDWGDGSAPTPFSASPVDAMHHFAGPSGGIEVRVDDGDGGEDVKTASVPALGYTLSEILQPINGNGSSVFKKKKGATIPVKVRITDCAGRHVSGLAPTIGVSRDSSLVDSDPVNEVLSASSADTTGRLREAGDHYLYNLATDELGVGSWTVYVRQVGASPSQVKASFSVK